AVAGPFIGHTDWATSVAFSPDGCRISSGSYDKTIRVWDAETGHAVAGPFVGHTYRVQSVAFSPDNHHVASGSFEKSMWLWEVIVHSAPEHSVSSSTPQDVLTTPIGAPVFTDQSVIDDDGWVCGENGELLMWIPEPHRHGLHRPSNT
ncbi:WD40-repeat-containing domain protein, partial [Gloeopeniophorella convolvens]